jgi:hypothetical protein
MKSTFKKQYEVNQKPGGSIELIVEGSRLGAFAKVSTLVPWIIISIAVYVGVFVVLSFLGIYLIGDRFLDRHGGKIAIVALLAPASLLKFVFGSRKNAIQLRPEGIEFANGKKQIAYDDIKSFGVMTESVSGSGAYAQTAYVYVDALGHRIKLTGHMKQELAEAIRDEIIKYYSSK